VSTDIDRDGRYTYADYCRWGDDERWELIDGVAYDMCAAPSHVHQYIVGNFYGLLWAQLEGHPCHAYVAPFDIRLPRTDEADDAVDTVVQPDIVVVCDKTKLDGRGCRGAPEFVVEVISPSTASKDIIKKTAVYESRGVKEYWIVHPVDRILFVRLLTDDGVFTPAEALEATGTIAVRTLEGVSIDFDRVFDGAPDSWK